MFTKTLRSLFLLLTLSFCSWAAADTVTLMQGLNGYAGTTDDKIACCSFAGTNMGNDTFYAFIAPTSTSLLIKFNIFASEGGPVPNTATINSATLSFYQYWGPTANWSATRLKKAWNETSANWNVTGTGASWTTAGAFSVGNDIESAADGSGTSVDAVSNGCNTSGPTFPAVCWLNIPVTAGVQAFKANPAGTNFGWKVIYTGGSPDPSKPKEFNSSENTSFPSLRPKLTIDYTPQGSCTPTAALSANPTSGVGPLAVTFNASGSSAPAGHDITSLNLQFGHNSQQATWGDKNVTQQYTYPAGQATYTATLTATNDCGTSAPVTQQITVTDQPGNGIPSSLPLSGVAIPSFHSMSLYYNPPSAPPGNREWLRYRLASDDPNVAGSWKQGHEMQYDARPVHNYSVRGSVVHLQPGTQYVFEVGTGASYASATWTNAIQGMSAEAMPSTWSETFPIGTVLTPFTGTNTTLTSSSYGGSRSGSTRQHVLYANQSGSPAGYTLYDFTGTAAVAQTSTTSNVFPVVVNGSYIIIRGLKTVGGESGIFIDPGSHDIVIENGDISGYGRDSGSALGSGLTGNRAANEDAGIKFPDSSYGPVANTKRIVIQRNKIHNPAFGSNPWDSGHPSGTSPITMYPTGGQIVIRYNSAYSTTNGQPDGAPNLSKYHQDGLILGGDNNAGIGPDIDVYKNLVMHYFDDGLETDGDGTNTRVWKNYFDYGGASAVSTAPTTIGPAYLWRNVYNRARMFITDAWGNERDRLYMFKASGLDGQNDGARYIYHNTSLQAPPSSEGAPGPNSLGAGFGAGGNGAPNGMHNTRIRNNVFEIWKSTWDTFDLRDAVNNDIDYDLSNGVFTEAHGLHNTPQYQAGNGWSSYWNGSYRLQPGTPGHDDGEVIPNFSDGSVGAPDRGAHEDGTPNMDFGTNASGS